ncbi:NAD-dependent epimerase/dehydratase family protein [Vibrio mimicus]|uniref:NAD-dependent epimerase/dehydratase family protein n=1 Tax=Vibrio mimicus TaxID=674 RepID=UPI0011D4AD3B|nr:NAD-dependent epimerase/dehydratase family protein [Vibrio mimicus]TXZ07007.1 NAD-dependent epimerase/dehydratase family protein [Vibrio mimicus]BCN22702.1 putative epimerase [Vibrio mimicus]
MRILVTGSSGFIGSALTKSILEKHEVITLGSKNIFGSKVEFINLRLENIEKSELSLSNIDVVVHCAGIADSLSGDLEEYRRINTLASINMAKCSARNGVKRFIYLSSAKVNGENSEYGLPFQINDIPMPSDYYAKSKLEAEVELQKFSQISGLDVVILRPALVYGPGVKGNFHSLLSLVSKGLPLPFASINCNKRSLVSVNNLVDLINVCIEHPEAKNGVFFVSDGQDLSTSEMIHQIGKALRKRTYQFNFPISCFKLIGRLLNRSSLIDRLVGSLQVDIRHTKKVLGWTPPYELELEFQKTVNDFLEKRNNGGFNDSNN